MRKNDTEAVVGDETTYLHRPRIYNLLENSVRKQLTVITAGAGYGKTRAVHDFLREYDAAPVWISLSLSDNLAARFWENVTRSFSVISAGLVTKLAESGFPDNEIKFGRFLSILEQELCAWGRHILVCDDFHLIYEQNILLFFERLINAKINGLSIIIVSRSKPSLNTVGLLSKNLLSAINEDSLRLSEDEIGDFFQLRKITLSGKAISEFYTYTGGWIFAVHLVCLSLKKGIVYRQNPLAAIKLDIFDLLEREVFSPLSEGARKLLIRLSLLENLPFELLRIMAEGNEALVREVLKISSFIMFDAYSNTYRIHHLFLDFLNEKQYVLEEGEVAFIHQRAAEWCAENGFKIDAISHYEKNSNYDAVADLLETYTVRIPEETASFLVEVIERIPEALVAKRPIIRVIHAKNLLNNFKAEEAYRKLYEVVAKYGETPPSEESKMVLGEAYIMLGFQSLMTYAFTGALDFTQYFKKAYEYLPEGSKINTGLSITSGNYVCAVNVPKKGVFEELLEAVENTVPYMSAVLNGTGSGYDYLTKAEYAYFTRDLKSAEQHAYQAIAKAREKGQSDIESFGLFLLIRIYAARGSYTKALGLIERQKCVSDKTSFPEAHPFHDITSGWFYAAIGHTENVADWIKVKETSMEVMSPITFAPDKLVRALCLLAENKIPELLALVDEKSEGFVFETFITGRLELMAIKAVALQRAKMREEASETLREAYALASPESLIMPFIAMGKDMRSLIRAEIGRGGPIPAQWLENVRMKASTYAKSIAFLISEHRKLNDMENDARFKLTNRETELLSDLCMGLTREEIAALHGLSANTVKNAIHIICEKLGAENTKDAIRIATSMRMI